MKPPGAATGTHTPPPRSQLRWSRPDECQLGAERERERQTREDEGDRMREEKLKKKGENGEGEGWRRRHDTWRRGEGKGKVEGSERERELKESRRVKELFMQRDEIGWREEVDGG